MNSHRFTACVAGLREGDAASLAAHLRRAAIATEPRKIGETVRVRSRRNAIFSAHDVLEVIVEWLRRDPACLEHAVVTLEEPRFDFMGRGSLAGALTTVDRLVGS